ncbi:unnamed protein product [marine sediment metagenome]|uniref:Uncharacterized protein n=1 Tax=marine sediment metagenome TaxID=412755 RepID=X1J320_9ZZZZ
MLRSDMNIMEDSLRDVKRVDLAHMPRGTLYFDSADIASRYEYFDRIFTTGVHSLDMRRGKLVYGIYEYYDHAGNLIATNDPGGL